MTEHLFLPTLSKTETGITLPKKGQWADMGSKIILDIANGIEITEKASKRGISSIPDIWARPLMFQSAIRQNSKHPLKERLINEWRGLMSLLALSDFKKYDLTVVPVELLRNPKIKNEIKSKSIFVNALLSLAPKGIQLESDQKYYWIDPELEDPILIIKLKGVPIGSFSPSTLVYTGSDYANLLSIKAPELKDFLIDSNGYLIPPSKDSDIEEISFIGKWLFELDKNLGKLTSDVEDKKGKQTYVNISELINNWLDEIRIKLGEAPDYKFEKVVGVKVAEQIDNKLGKTLKFIEEDKYKIYQLLLKPIVTKESDVNREKRSGMTLDYSRNLTDYKEIIIINEKLLISGKKIWDTKSLKDLEGDSKFAIKKYFSSGWGTKIDNLVIDTKTEDGKKAGIWIRPELYFLSNKLLKAKDGDFFVEKETSWNPNDYVWPFKKEIFNFFTPSQIIEILKPKFILEGDYVRFLFTLPVSSYEVQIEKTYRKAAHEGEGEIVEMNVPVIEIFPDYIGQNWRRYYLLQSHFENLSIIPFVPTTDYKLNNRVSNISIEKKDHRVRISELRGDDVFPEGIEILSHNNEPIGLILINKFANRDKVSDNVLKDTMEIGIDFGTSNTNIYYKHGNLEGFKWEFDFPRYIRQISFSDSKLRAEILNNSFIPTKITGLPIPTALLNNYNTLEEPSLLLDYFIFFANGYKIPQNVYTNLKWESEDNAHKDKKSLIKNTDWFIESLLFLIFLDICNKNIDNVIIGFSYPKAFSQTDRSRFGIIWNDALSKLYNGEDRIVNVYDINNPNGNNKPSIQVPYKLTEGIAAGYFFSNPNKFNSKEIKKIDKATLTTGAICLDVGGATTDISIWCERADNLDIALFDTSVLIAGKEICEYIRSKPELWNLLFSPDAKNALFEKKNSEDQFAAMLNMILKSEEKDVFTNLSKNIKNSDLQALMKIILIEFGAIAYYTSMLCIKANLKSDNQSLMTRIMESGINLYWGGNGAKFISWLDFGLFNVNSTCVRFLNTIFYYGLVSHEIEPHDNILQFASPEPKSEACGGLIFSDPTQREGSKKSNSGTQTGSIVKLNIQGITNIAKNINIIDDNTFVEFVCGEKIELTDSTILDSLYSIDNMNLFIDKKTILKNTTLSELIMFIEILNKTAVALGLLNQGDEIDLNEIITANIRIDILESFKTMQKKDAVERRIEPIFIMEVKKLIQEIGK